MKIAVRQRILLVKKHNWILSCEIVWPLRFVVGSLLDSLIIQVVLVTLGDGGGKTCFLSYHPAIVAVHKPRKDQDSVERLIFIPQGLVHFTRPGIKIAVSWGFII